MPIVLEAEVKRAMLEQAEQPVLLLDESKLTTRGRQSVARIADVSIVLAHGLGSAAVTALEAVGAHVCAVRDDECQRTS